MSIRIHTPGDIQRTTLIYSENKDTPHQIRGYHMQSPTHQPRSFDTGWIRERPPCFSGDINLMLKTADISHVACMDASYTSGEKGFSPGCSQTGTKGPPRGFISDIDSCVRTPCVPAYIAWRSRFEVRATYFMAMESWPQRRSWELQPVMSKLQKKLSYLKLYNKIHL
jgi:hypothetical protein